MPDVPERLEYLQNIEGVEETKDVLKFLAKIGQAVNLSLLDDDKITVSDAFKFIDPIIALPDAISGIKDVPSELLDDLTDEELAELGSIIESAGVLSERTLDAVKEALEIAEKLKAFILEYFVRPAQEG
jgi:hypothetical protein